MIVAFCTTPDRKTASRIAKMLVEEGVAACVNIVKVDETVYKWEGKMVKGKEHLMVIKARKENWGKLKKKIKDVHPYSVPEIVSVETYRVAEPYLDWVYGGGAKKRKKK